MGRIKILCVGDVVGVTGRTMFQKHIDTIREKYAIDGIIVNGENSGHGRGISSRIVRFFKHNKVNVITSGNHIWYNKEIYSYLSSANDLLRPANYPRSAPGVGVTTFECAGHTVGVINLQGRVFMRDHIDCPFRTAESALSFLQTKTNTIIIDFHAEATSEKMAMAYFLDGKISALFGTHTHVQTADERILPQGTAFISDVGMVGSLNSMLGMKKESIIEHFITQLPVKFTVEHSAPVLFNGVVMELDTQTGKATGIERISIIDPDIHITEDGE
ncbi:TIGR00282 family metallophosphoesterase [Candidatus Dependentiae bacterium HGW-Dependentiae-1]|nr:MAG: TIGR00282 family metallophosphoesterase [Candidatus Dependentiae bacterium HGW-Dependentiae-1]